MPSDPDSPGSIRSRVGLTGRGWWFLGTGLALAAVGLLRGWTPAVQFGLLIALLPLTAALLTPGPTPGRLELRRELSSREVAAGDRLKVTVSVRGRFPRGRSLLFEDAAPIALGGPHRFALNGISGQGFSQSHYRPQARARGIHRIGPMRIHATDRYGMVHRTVTAGQRDEIIVHPRVVDLDPTVLSGASAGAGSGHLGARGAGTDDVIPREYRPGDEVRRMDWKASARTGALMVRSEENPWRSAITIVLDLRAAAHQGHEPESSVDYALSMAASIGCLALENGWDLTVRSTDDTALFIGSPMTGVRAERHELLLALATAPLSRSLPSQSLGYSAQAGGPGPLILITGHIGMPVARLLSGIGMHNPTRILVPVATEQWDTDHHEPGSGHGPGTGARDDALPWFHQAGWRIARLQRTGDGPGSLAGSVTQAWTELAVTR
ncbi:MAG TPA: DUF58 domain-containing protein [Motilibacterales bacterium]|nr:DUF58 domain-containing protein [Motilibacterales bacterium]